MVAIPWGCDRLPVAFLLGGLSGCVPAISNLSGPTAPTLREPFLCRRGMDCEEDPRGIHDLPPTSFARVSLRTREGIPTAPSIPLRLGGLGRQNRSGSHPPV